VWRGCEKGDDEVRRDKTNMRENVHHVFAWLETELEWIDEKWKAYLQLSNHTQLDLFESIACDFFAMCKEVMGHDVVLALCRFTDRAETCGRQNTTLERLVNEVRASGDQKLVEILEPLLNQVKLTCRPLRTYRNRRLGHNDLKACLKIQEQVVPGVDYATIEQCLKTIEQMMQQVLLYYDGIATEFCTHSDEAVKELIWKLRRLVELDPLTKSPHTD